MASGTHTPCKAEAAARQQRVLTLLSKRVATSCCEPFPIGRRAIGLHRPPGPSIANTLCATEQPLGHRTMYR
eukprot:201743-Chlamydomonas_euryale.AAC.3